MADLAELQRRFRAFVVDGAEAGALIAGAPRIYAHAYASRLSDALAEDHPKLRAALGDAAFAALVAAYVRALPPSGFSLRALGAALPAFLADGAGGLDVPPWAAELAALERARVEVFDGPDAAPLARAAVAALAPGEFAALELAWVPASAVVSIGWRVDALWREIEDGAATVAPPRSPRPRAVLVWRREMIVRHRTLDEDEGGLADSLARGASIAELSEMVREPARVAEFVRRWIDAHAVVAMNLGRLEAGR